MIPRLRSDRTREIVAEATCPETNCALLKKTLSEEHPRALRLITPPAREQELSPTEEEWMLKLRLLRSSRDRIPLSVRQLRKMIHRLWQDLQEDPQREDRREDLLQEKQLKHRRNRSRSGSVSRKQTDRSLHGALPPRLLMMKDRVALS